MYKRQEAGTVCTLHSALSLLLYNYWYLENSEDMSVFSEQGTMSTAHAVFFTTASSPPVPHHRAGSQLKLCAYKPNCGKYTDIRGLIDINKILAGYSGPVLRGTPVTGPG